MANEGQFNSQPGLTLTYRAEEPDGTERTSATVMTETDIGVSGHYIVNDSNVVAGDNQIVYDAVGNVYGGGIYQPEVTVVNLTAIAASVWDVLTSGITTVGSIGVWILEKLDVVVSTRATEAKQDIIDTNVDTLITNANPDETLSPSGGTLTTYEKGTTNVISIKNLFDPSNNAVDSIEDIIAKSVEQ